MTNGQLFLALVGVLVTVVGAQTLLLNARISDVKEQVNQLIQYMVVTSPSPKGDGFSNHSGQRRS